MVSICCNKSSDKTKNSSKETKSSRRKKKWNPLACLVCRGCCKCHDKTSDKNKESSSKTNDRKQGKQGNQLACFRCRGERVMGCSCCENSSDDPNKNPSKKTKEKKNKGKAKNRLACLVCRGEKRMGCLCCAKSSDEGTKSPRIPKERKERKKSGCNRCNKSSDESSDNISRIAKEQNEEKKFIDKPLDNSNKSSRTENKQNEEKKFIAKSSDESNKSSMTENKQNEEKEGKKGCCFFGTETSKGSIKSSRKIEEHQREKKKVRFACLFHRGESGCFCCAKSSDKNKAPSRNTKELENGKKRKKISCCARSSDENKKASRKKNEQRKGSHLAFLVNSISLNSDGDRQKSEAEEILRIGNDSIAARVFHYHELSAATRNFKPECLLGEGGFGRVYKGKLEDTNQIVAVKQLDRNGFQGNREFLVEVLMLSLLHHQNLVKLLGYCAEGDQRILVYEYMPQGSLEDHLLAISADRRPLDWNTRMKIALGSAKGLEYLHEIANPPVIYRDFKAPNILLDKDYNPKLSDFGLAKLGPMGDKSHVSTRVMGTYGYCAPEYAKTGQLTKMSDVYSFGVVLLEIITGRRAFDVRRPRNEQQLVHWAAPFFRDKRYFVKMADPLLQGKYPLRALYQAVAVAAMCIQDEASTRPGISDVVIALEYLSFQTDDLSEGSKGELPRTGSEIETSTVGN